MISEFWTFTYSKKELMQELTEATQRQTNMPVPQTKTLIIITIKKRPNLSVKP